MDVNNSQKTASSPQRLSLLIKPWYDVLTPTLSWLKPLNTNATHNNKVNNGYRYQIITQPMSSSCQLEINQ